MNTPVLVCDDSQTARRQVAHALARRWQVEPVYADNGAEAMNALRGGAARLMLLDLNMPVMDGYEVLRRARIEAPDTAVVVLSGDIQPEARRRALALGAVDFIAKPLREEELRRAIEACPLPLRPAPRVTDAARDDDIETAPTSEWDCYAELANVAVGRAADLLARLLGVFVNMPRPHVDWLEDCDLHMALGPGSGEGVRSISQGFIAAHVRGEALLLVHDSSFPELARLLHNRQAIDSDMRMELLMDVGNIIIGACLKSIAEQIDLDFSLGHPVLLDRDRPLARFRRGAGQRTLAIEMNVSFAGNGLDATLLLLFDRNSLSHLRRVTGALR